MRTLLFFAVFLLSACAGTFEETRPKLSVNTNVMARATSSECHTYSEREYWLTGGGILFEGVAAAASGLVLPVTSREAETALVLTASGSAVVGAGLAWYGSHAGSQYIAAGCLP